MCIFKRIRMAVDINQEINQALSLTQKGPTEKIKIGTPIQH